MKSQILVLRLALCLLLAGAASLRGASLEAGFANPPPAASPWCYWYWISDNISREGITRDLEAMKRVGITEALIGNIFMEDTRRGSVVVLSEEWWGMVEHAIREGGRIGVNVGLFNCPGWSQSGGPWITPEQGMRYVAFSERRVKGPSRFEEPIPAPKDVFEDLAVLAFPAPQGEAGTLARMQPQVTAGGEGQSPESGSDLPRLVDGDWNTTIMLPPGVGQGSKAFLIDIETAEPFSARSLVLVPARSDFAGNCELLVSDGDRFKTVRGFAIDRSNNGVAVGFVPHAPVAVSFPEVTARKFRLRFTQLRGKPGLAEVQLSPAATVERYYEKQLAKMHPTPLPMWGDYLWPATSPAEPPLAVNPRDVRDLSQELQPDGTLLWDVPAGDWVILRAGLTPTGTKNTPASPEGQGLEVDKMNAKAARAHFEAYIGQLLRRMPKSDRVAFKRVVADSYEMGSQNWTIGLRDLFQKRFGYDPQPFVPVLTGRLVGSSEQSDRFLWDLRRLVADQVSYGYVGGLRQACNDHGLRLWLENYGHWGFPGEFLQYGGQSDNVSGEFWSTGELGSIELRAAASAAHTYGKPIVSAEAFTSVQKYESTPWSMKKRGDWALTEGINHWVLHVYIHQPDERQPGVNAWFTTEFNRHNTWFEQGREWFDYYRRCQYLLQQGKHVADVAYFIGEDTPKMTGIRSPALPTGYNFDYINAEVIQTRLRVRNGRFVLPDGMSYRLLVLPPLDTMRPELLTRLRDLVKAGGTILGPAPSRSPSLQNYPECDRQVRALAAELWGPAATAPASGAMAEHKYGKGRVFQAGDLAGVLDRLSAGPDVSDIDPKTILWIHRSAADAEIYFLSNQGEQPVTISPLFRVRDRQPEFWDPVSARTHRAALFSRETTGTRVPLRLEPRGSMFVVFRSRSGSTPAVSELTHAGKPVLSTAKPEPAPTRPKAASAPGTFTMAAWVKPAIDIALPAESDSGVALDQLRNELVTPFHGDNAFPEGGHAGAGISVGRNGVVVYEHSGNYFAPLLSHRAPITDWTHIAVVYLGNRPSLYLNGKLARQGLQSRYKVHSGFDAEPSGNSSFKGAFAGVETFGLALSEADLAALQAHHPGRGAAGMPIEPQLYREKSGLVLHAPAAGEYGVKWENGRTQTIRAGSLPAPIEIPGPWNLKFSPNRDRIADTALPELVSLTAHEDEAIRHTADTAIYTRTFGVPPGYVVNGRRLWLDLGQVESLAEVDLNGRNLGILWKPPYLVEVTDVVKAGENSLVIQVTGTWRNRLIGDAKHPNGFPGHSGSAPFKPYLGMKLGLRADEPLTPFGLMGPVRLLTSAMVPVR